MIDIIPYVAELLEPLGAQIELSYRDTEVTFPLIVLTTVSNAPQILDKVEYFTRIIVQVDAYTLDKGETVRLAQQIDDIMREHGFRLSNAFPLTEGELERYQMSYNCSLDFSHTRIITT
ncbi:MAG: hypothetical protein J6N15_09550 [Ruminiclostridium sp.]|nr:hypothetical protein [Ruminiclostridium sp.]